MGQDFPADLRIPEIDFGTIHRYDLGLSVIECTVLLGRPQTPPLYEC